MKIERALVTGGAGFIGSHLVERLLAEGVETVVFDDFSTGQARNLNAILGHPRLKVYLGDTRDRAALGEAMRGVDTVFHFQANADVRGGISDTRVDLEQNTIATWNVCEAAREAGVATLVLASSAAVYGEPERIPTPEDEPLVQTSLYGASKLAGEAMMQAYAEYYGMRTLAFRFVSCVGPRYRHGVVADFVGKLRAEPGRLEILGDGRQRKSFLEVRDLVAGVWLATTTTTERKAVYNLGHSESMDVLTVARVVTEEMGLKNVELCPAGGERGWVGDSPVVELDTTKIRALGWSPEITVEAGLRTTVRDLMARELAGEEKEADWLKKARGRVSRPKRNVSARIMGWLADHRMQLALVLLLALVIRLFFFVGLTFALDQDEGIYLNHAAGVLDGHFTVNFTDKPADYLPDPAEAFQFRYPMIYVPAWAFRLFGINDFSAVLFALICSLGSVWLTERVARLYVSPRVALLAAGLMAIFPLDVLFSTRLMPDAPMAFFFWLGIYLYLLADREEARGGWFRGRREGLFMAAGLVFGITYLIKLAVVFVGGMVLAHWALKRRINWRSAWVIAGFAIVFGIEGLCYVRQGDSFFLNLAMNTRVYESKFLKEEVERFVVIPGVFNFYLTDTTVLFYTRLIWEALNPLEPSMLSWLVPSGLLAAAVAIYRRERRLYLMAAWIWVLYLMLEFMPVRLVFNADGAWINHYLVSQRIRYLTIIGVPMAVLVAWWISSFRYRTMQAAFLLLLLFTSLHGIAYHRDWLRAGMVTLNEGADVLKRLPERFVITDPLAREFFQYRFGWKRNDDIKNGTEYLMPWSDVYVVVGGTRGMDMSYQVVNEYTEQILRKRDETWVEIARIQNPVRDYYGPEQEDLVIYYVPPNAKWPDAKGNEPQAEPAR